MLNGSVVVTAKEGTLQVDDHGATKNVTKGQSIVSPPRPQTTTKAALLRRWWQHCS